MKKTVSALVVFAAVVAAWGVLPALADPDLVGNITAFDYGPCYPPGTITVLGKEVTIDSSTVFKGAPCEDLGVGDRVKIGCTDNTCDTAAYVDFGPPISAESSIASITMSFCDCSDPDNWYFTLSNGVTCDYADAEIKDKKNFTGGPTTPPTPEELCNFLCGATLGTTPGTLLVKCEGHYDSGANEIDPATKVELKQ